MRLLAALSICALALFGCELSPDEQQRYYAPDVSVRSMNRFAVVRVGVFQDTISSGVMRGIYLITDRKTEREYLGVSGIGMSEVGSRTNER